MWEMYLSMALSVMFQVLKNVIKDAELKVNMKRAFLKLRDAINVAYGDTDEFFAVLPPQYEKLVDAKVLERQIETPPPTEETDAAEKVEGRLERSGVS